MQQGKWLGEESHPIEHLGIQNSQQKSRLLKHTPASQADHYNDSPTQMFFFSKDFQDFGRVWNLGFSHFSMQDLTEADATTGPAQMGQAVQAKSHVGNDTLKL